MVWPLKYVLVLIEGVCLCREADGQHGGGEGDGGGQGDDGVVPVHRGRVVAGVAHKGHRLEAEHKVWHLYHAKPIEVDGWREFKGGSHVIMLARKLLACVGFRMKC